MPRLDFWTKNFGEGDVLVRAQRQTKDKALKRTIEILYYNPDVSNEEITSALSDVKPAVALDAVKLQLRPRAKELIDQARAQNNVAPDPSGAAGSPKSDPLGPLPSPSPLAATSIDDLEAQAVTIMSRSHSGVTLNAKIKKVVIFIFKTFAPIAVLFLTIPESYWVFTHLYTSTFAQDKVLPILTGVFAVLTDFGYLYLTILLEMNKEAMFKRRRAGLEVEEHELKAVKIQASLWWAVACMDILAQFVFLYSATHGSTFFDPNLVIALACVRVFSLFITMFVVSFAGTELMTDVDVVANEQIERAEKLSRVLASLGKARQKVEQSKIDIAQMIEDQERRREDALFMRELHTAALDDNRRMRDELRRKSTDGNNKKL